MNRQLSINSFDSANIPPNDFIFIQPPRLPANSPFLTISKPGYVYDPRRDSGVTIDTANAQDQGITARSYIDISSGGSERPAQPTRDEVRAAFMEFLHGTGSRNGRRMAVEIILQRHGVSKVYHVPEDKLADVLACLRLIEKHEPMHASEVQSLLDEHMPLTDENGCFTNNAGDCVSDGPCIQAAVDEVEKVGADPLLTEAVNLLAQAREKLADYVDARLREVV